MVKLRRRYGQLVQEGVGLGICPVRFAAGLLDELSRGLSGHRVRGARFLDGAVGEEFGREAGAERVRLGAGGLDGVRHGLERPVVVGVYDWIHQRWSLSRTAWSARSCRR